jgi:thioredoxin reductase (NADPH)
MLKNTENAKISTLELTGIFIAIGSEPNSAQWGLLPSDQVGYAITNELMEMKSSGIFTGDVHHNSARQAITDPGEGATAAISAGRFLSF